MRKNDWQERTRLLLGEKNVEVLNRSSVLVAGLGGVGGYAAEALCRAGVGRLLLADSDRYMASNRNRQNGAFLSTEGQLKTEVIMSRLKDINPEVSLEVYNGYLKDEAIPGIMENNIDYVLDAIDTLSPKVYLIKEAIERQLPLVSSMGAGGRLDPGMVRVADISESFGCPFAQAVRKKLYGLGIRSGFRVVFSPEPVIRSSVIVTDNSPNKKSTVGTVSYMPAIFGFTAASVVIRSLCEG
ncbi:MAG: tRNA threonylcarbamoyladenosine dehydratase [Bacteroidales bacterium]